jgi:hypothetical protein
VGSVEEAVQVTYDADWKQVSMVACIKAGTAAFETTKITVYKRKIGNLQVIKANELASR